MQSTKMKISTLFTLLVPSISAAVLPARHTLNEVCFHVSARSSPWDGEAEEIPLGPEFDENFCLDNRFNALYNSQGQQCSMGAPDYRFQCHHRSNATTTFEIIYPAADGTPYLTYDSAPGMFYACPADSDPEYTFDLFSAKVSFGSVCVPVTLTLEPVEKSCPSGNNSSISTTSIISPSSTTLSSEDPTGTADGNDEVNTTETSSTESTNTERRTTTTSRRGTAISATSTASSAAISVKELEVNTRTSTRDDATLLTSSFGRPIPSQTIDNSAGSTSSTPEGRGSLTTFKTGTTSASRSMTTMPPVLFVPTTTRNAADATDEPSTAESSSTPARICSVPSSAPSIAPWRVGSSANTPAFNDFDSTGEAALTDKNSTVFEFVIPANFGMSTSALMGLEGTEDIDESADLAPSISGNGLCALQFRLPFCNNLPNGYPCYSFSGTTQEVKDNAGVLFSLLHNGGTVEWDDEAMHQLFPGKNTILGTFDCEDIGGGEVGDRTMSWLGSSVQDLGLEFLQAGGAESEFEDGVGAWVVACQD